VVRSPLSEIGPLIYTVLNICVFVKALALAGLNQLVTELNALVADGGTEAERQALADKLDVITADLAATIPDLPEPV